MASAHQEKFTRSLLLYSNIKYITISNSNAVNGSEDHFIREEIPRDLDDGDDKADQEGAGEDDDVDDLDPFSDSDD